MSTYGQGEPLYSKSKRSIQNAFIIGATVVVSIVAVIAVVMEWAFIESGWMEDWETSWLVPGVVISVSVIIAGVSLSLLASRFYLKPFNDIVDGMDQLGKGKFDTRIGIKGWTEMVPVYESFNSLARELQSVEILRSDFINNFSHEFKTPIQSINGLIGLMKNNELPRAKQIEYLKIIEEETDRLSFITTNILNMSKIENQGILTDKKAINVSEQIRMCVLLLERRWTQKKLELSMDFDENVVTANEDMLKQVWINLLDNAIKFANEGGALAVDLSKNDGMLTVKIGNTGPEIDEKDREKIFNKFYQVDVSHSRSGNGIGLSIVKQIVELHGGKVSCGRENDMTVFTVVLPE